MKEGNLLNEPKFDIKGLDIKKVKTPKFARKYIGGVLEKYMLQTQEIDPLSVFDRFINFERMVKTSLSSGETRFLRPSKYGSMDGYKFPGQQMAFRGVILWNALYPKRSIPDFSNVNLLKLRTIDIDKLEQYFDEQTIERLNGYLDFALPKIEGKDEEKQKLSLKEYGIDILALPKSETKVPKEFIPLINTTSIIDDNMKNAIILLESIGFKVTKSLKQSTYTNIVDM